MKILVFTDLDGSLLNHDDYSFEEARPSLSRLLEVQIPLIIVTSKTCGEVKRLQNTMGIRDPFIVENGGGIFFPRGHCDFSLPGDHREEDDGVVLPLGLPYDLIRSLFVTLKRRFKITGYGDLSPEDVARMTGLTVAEAELAKARQFSEPFLLEFVRDLPALESMAAEKGMKIVSGGRFYHLIGARQDKGVSVRGVRDIYRRKCGREHIAIGVGDSENDLPMLREVDIPVLIPHPERGYLDISLPGLLKAREPGCRGWNEAVGRILDELQTNGS